MNIDETLRLHDLWIAGDPEGFARRQGLGELDLSERIEAESLRRLWEALQVAILKLIEIIEQTGFA